MIDYNGKRKKFHESDSTWLQTFSLTEIKCLIVCRGPVRKEAMEVFDEIGIKEYGILLSEKDSIVYPMCLAPELRDFRFQNNIHRVPDYMGSGKEEKIERINQIIQIAKLNHYTHIFAGYGFMSEDAEFIEQIEKHGITFMGPASYVAKRAGSKDEAKKLARKLKVSVTPGTDNISSLALIAKVGNKDGLNKLAKEKNLNFHYDEKLSIEENTENLLNLGYDAIVELVTISDLQNQAEVEVKKIWEKFPGKRVRFKYIGGGGGKGQRVVGEVGEIKSAVQDILSESKVTSPGTNRNFLIELNIESTRHNEIQLVGNGEWCISLGGRDCSLQMHEQKLLEISLTQELLEQEIAKAEKISKERAEIFKADLKTLQAMEKESETFGQAVNLNSVSTFESIIEGPNHFFMEMNTRIQVEHRVTEMAYSLKFTNHSNPKEFFVIDSLIEMMAILSLHAKKLKKPERIVRNISGAEARINATNMALQPHAGGLILNWSKPLPGEIRDDQGIGTRNPDTNMFVHYNLAGAYDSNIALVVSTGESRRANLENLAEIIRRTEMRGQDLQTNYEVHYGLIHWILGQDSMFKPSTKFMLPYLAAVGSLASLLKDFDLQIIWKSFLKQLDSEAISVLNLKLTLITRPIEKLFANPHVLSGFLGFHNGYSWLIEKEKVTWIRNPLSILIDLYHYLDLNDDPTKSPSEKIWEHDLELLNDSSEFYKQLFDLGLIKRIDSIDFTIFENSKSPSGEISQETWDACVRSHNGFQLGLDILKIIPEIGIQTGFYKLSMDQKLEEVVPKEFSDTASRDKLIKFLAPLPKSSSDEIVAPMGGMYYSKEAPGLPSLIEEGQHFKQGQPLFIIEVMKMFNKILAPFDGKILKNQMKDSDGKIISKGQVIFKIQPDEIIHEETDEEKETRTIKITMGIFDLVLK